MTQPQIFISCVGEDAFTVDLLQYALETLLATHRLVAWTFNRDQARSERGIAQRLKERVRESIATIFLLSPATLDDGSTQWMELAYADAFEIPTFLLLHHIEFEDLRQWEGGVPPLLLAGQCNLATAWRQVVDDIRGLLEQHRS